MMRRWWWWRQRWQIPMTTDTFFQASLNSSSVLITVICFLIEWPWSWSMLTGVLSSQSNHLLTHSPRTQAYLHTHHPWSTEQKRLQATSMKSVSHLLMLALCSPSSWWPWQEWTRANDDLWKFISLGNVNSSGNWRIQGTPTHPVVLQRTWEGSFFLFVCFLFVTFNPPTHLTEKLNSQLMP